MKSKCPNCSWLRVWTTSGNDLETLHGCINMYILCIYLNINIYIYLHMYIYIDTSQVDTNFILSLSGKGLLVFEPWQKMCRASLPHPFVISLLDLLVRWMAMVGWGSKSYVEKTHWSFRTSVMNPIKIFLSQSVGWNDLQLPGHHAQHLMEPSQPLV